MEVSKQIKELNKKLYPTGRAWGYVHGSEQVDTEVTYFVDGLGNRFVDGLGNAFVSISGSEASPSKRLVNSFLKSYERFYENLLTVLDQRIADNENFDSTDASNWERIYGLQNNGLTLEQRKENILRRQSYPNGVVERGNYKLIESELQKAGFDVYLTENRFANGLGGWNVIEPDDAATNEEQFGLSQFGTAEFGGDILGLDYTICANNIDENIDVTFFEQESSLNQFGTAEFGESQFEIASNESRETQLRATFFVGGASYPSIATVPIARKEEFRQLILKLKPTQTVAFLYINYI